MSIPLYIPEPLADTPLALWFKPQRAGVFDEQFPPNFFEHEVTRVAPEEARAIVLPNNFLTITKETDRYIQKYIELGEKLHIPVFLFSVGDFTDHLTFDPRVYAFRFSVYGSTVAPRDIVMPTLTEDNAKEGISIRTKLAKPLVSFCGMGGFPSWRGWAGYLVKVVLHTVRGSRPHIVGVYWRRLAMRACERSSLVDTHFIVRKSFSGNRKSIELDPKVARKEYLDSIINSDFVIAPKGDGNYSNRFVKALCMGRIPVLVDTDTVLPLKEVIDYTKISVTVPMNRVGDTAKYIREFYDSLTEEEWQARQALARETFEKYLRQDSFFTYFFTEVLPKLSV